MSGPAEIAQAVALLKSGNVVAIPTETVYGLGADASNFEAVRKIFALKGRPADHPLIVHLHDAGQLTRWTADVTKQAIKLSAKFWPGPLTVILRRAKDVPLEVTGGLDTVGLRIPSHPVARELLCEFEGGIAAPSANRFGRVSPTTAQHVREEFGAELPLILDGGPCSVGVESTIVDLSSDAPAVLRPGGITQEQLEAALGVPVPFRVPGNVRAPGTLEAHYAPSAQVVLCAIEEVQDRLVALKQRNLNVALISWQEPATLESSVSYIPMPMDAEGQARELYSALRRADELHCDAALVTLPDATGVGAAVVDRLKRAAASVRLDR